MPASVIVGVVGTAIAVMGVIFIVLFLRWMVAHGTVLSNLGTDSESHAYRPQVDPVVNIGMLHHSISITAQQVEQTDRYREELKDSFVERNPWRCRVCRFRNHPDRKMCDLCQTIRGVDREIAQRCATRPPYASSKQLHGDGTPMLGDPQRPTAMSKLQLAASRRFQWKRMPAGDGLHRWVRQPVRFRRDSIGSEGSSSYRPSSRLTTATTDERDSVVSTGYIRVRDSIGRLVLNESDTVATDFSYRINVTTATGISSELVMNLERVHNLPFADKLRWFTTELHRLWLPWESGHVELCVRRDHIVEDSFRIIHNMKPYEMRQRWRVVFKGEPALDAGGVMREWFTLLFDQIFDQEFGLFVSTVGDERSYWINANSGRTRLNHLAFFEFAGRVLGKAILEEHLSTVHLALPFLKHILGVPISFSDLQFLDDEIYRSAIAVRESDDVEPFCLDFTITRLGGEGEAPQIIELIPNGSNIDVTTSNRVAYIDALFKYYVLDSVSDQLLAFLTALYDIVPEGLLKLFDYQELELLMCGVPAIDTKDWRKHTDIKYFTDQVPTDLEITNIQWFWQIIEAMPNTDRVRLLQFTTGTSRVPAQGFKGLISSDGRVRQFNIAFMGANLEVLFPKAHTCFNRLDLPIYSSREQMSEYLHLIVQMDITGFNIE